MGILLDVLIVLFILFIAWRGWRRGFVRTVIDLAGYILAGVIAFALSGMIAGPVYNAVIAPTVNSTVSSAVQSVKINQGTNTADIDNTVDQIYSKLPQLVKNSVPSDEFRNEIQKLLTQTGTEVNTSASSVAQTATDNIAAPFFITLVRYVLALIIFIVLLFVVRIVARMVNRLFSFSVIGGINRFFGGIIGILKGTLYAALLATGFSLLVQLAGGSIGGITPDVIGSTTVFHLFVIQL